MILVVGHDPRFTDGVVGGLTYEGYRVRHVVQGARARKLKADRFEVDFSSSSSLMELKDLLKARDDDRIGTIISFLGAGRDAPSSPSSPLSDDSAWNPSFATFQVARAFFHDLNRPLGSGPVRFVNITAMDGAFGLDAGRTFTGGALSLGGAASSTDDDQVHGPGPTFDPAGAGTVGLAKALMRECPDLEVRNIDVDPRSDPQVIVGRIFQELQSDHGELEVGLGERGRRVLRLGAGNGSNERGRGLPLDSDSVVLITGGAAGITAEVARGLAAKVPCRFMIVGRSPLPGEEELPTRSLDRDALRAHFIQQMRASGERSTPAEIEASVRRLFRDREILRNLAALRALGAEAEYHSIDVSDRRAFGDLIGSLYDRFGRIDGVIHGAGVIEDKRIPDKSEDSFRRVFQTKVAGAQVLSRCLRPEGLRFVAFFSSVSARFGNAGQSDYSAANEYLNKLANLLNAQWPARVVSINWGPWDAGMVSDDLKRLYAERGVGLLSVSDGVRACLEELTVENGAPAEVTVACGLDRFLPSMGRGP